MGRSRVRGRPSSRPMLVARLAVGVSVDGVPSLFRVPPVTRCWGALIAHTHSLVVSRAGPSLRTALRRTLGEECRVQSVVRAVGTLRPVSAGLVIRLVSRGCPRRPSCPTAQSIVESKDLKYIMVKGCIDTTTMAPMERPAAMCSGLVACNLIETDHGGPWCGTWMGQYGRMTQGAGSESQQANAVYANA